MRLIVLTEAEFRAILSEMLQNNSTHLNEGTKLEEQPVTQHEICAFLNITEPTIIRWRKKGIVPFLKIGSRVLYQKTAVVAAITGNKKGVGRGK